MISSKTARKMGVEFFNQQGVEEFADLLERSHYICIDALFGKMITSLGKAKVHALYFKLPTRLRHYVLTIITHPELDFIGLDGRYKRVRESERPERLKNFHAYMDKLQEVVLRFLIS